MRSVPSHNTSPEIRFRSRLWHNKCRYRVNNKELPGKPDIVIKSKRAVVFIDGDFWHGNQWKKRGFNSLEEQFKDSSNKKYWINKIKRNVQRDIAVNEVYKQMGWEVFRFWESDIQKDVDKCVNHFLNNINNKQNENR